MQCHLLSFEGPDAYAEAGGIASRIKGLSNALVHAGFETHLWFVGDPQLPGYEKRAGLHLHRWCQWISQYHPIGVYDGEEGKRSDYASSLPPYLLTRVLGGPLIKGEPFLVMAEEWHTVDAILHLDWLLRQRGLRDQATLLWNANNTFGFERINWARLREAAVITTVSRYMKGLLHHWGVDAVVISNGLAEDAYLLPEEEALRRLREKLPGRTLIAKVARWDSAKRWVAAIQAVAAMKSEGWRPLLIARGGTEPYGTEILRTAATLGLRVRERALFSADERGMLGALDGVDEVDVLNLLTPVEPKVRGLLFAGADAVLANSSHEPFGLVGLETMAVKGIACIGNTGEDYAIPGYNAIVMESDDPREFIRLYAALKASPVRERALKNAARRTAQQYAWMKIIRRVLLPKFSALTVDSSAPVKHAASRRLAPAV
jgi:glycosyltransferase involved in cell wall biosynthesis